MTKAAKRNSQPFPASLEVIEANNFHQISCASTSFDSTKEGSDSSNSFSSSSSSDLMEDASSSSSSSSSSSNGPLYQLSDLMAQLPIKRGLSKYYQGKSQSFTSLASVERLEDLAKRENPYRRRIKYCKSYCGGLVDGQRLICSPKAAISKKTSSSRASSSFKKLGGISCRPPLVPVQKDF